MYYLNQTTCKNIVRVVEQHPSSVAFLGQIWLVKPQMTLMPEDSWLVVKQIPLKNMKVKWDDDIPNIWENKKMFQTTNQIP